jgi:capsule polysaccharide modification protein KpsS
MEETLQRKQADVMADDSSAKLQQPSSQVIDDSSNHNMYYTSREYIIRAQLAFAHRAATYARSIVQHHIFR